jgi:hypothetical protein
MTSLLIGRVAGRNPRQHDPYPLGRQLILMTVVAASKAAKNISPSSQGDTQGNIELANRTCKRRANCLNPKEIRARPHQSRPAAF